MYVCMYVCMYVHMQPEMIVERMKRSGEIDKRPLLKQAADPAAALRKLYDERKKNYSLVSQSVGSVNPTSRGPSRQADLA